MSTSNQGGRQPVECAVDEEILLFWHPEEPVDHATYARVIELAVGGPLFVDLDLRDDRWHVVAAHANGLGDRREDVRRALVRAGLRVE